MKANLKFNISMLKAPESVSLQTDQVSLKHLINSLAIIKTLAQNFSYSLCRGLGLGTTLGAPEGRGDASELRDGVNRSFDRSGSASSFWVP